VPSDMDKITEPFLYEINTCPGWKQSVDTKAGPLILAPFRSATGMRLLILVSMACGSWASGNAAQLAWLLHCRIKHCAVASQPPFLTGNRTTSSDLLTAYAAMLSMIILVAERAWPMHAKH
jgi:hypothetical protein